MSLNVIYHEGTPNFGDGRLKAKRALLERLKMYIWEGGEPTEEPKRHI